jgi:hypothetical protein
MNLDAANLEAILQEARECFLYEDAPGYLASLSRASRSFNLDWGPHSNTQP